MPPNDQSPYPDKTYELCIAFTSADHAARLRLKEHLKSWLTARGLDSFVEGTVDELDIAFDYANPERNYFREFGGDLSPLAIYKYDRQFIDDLKDQLTAAFADGIACTVSEIDTRQWTEGWKESFRPIETEHVFVYPPWEHCAVPPGKEGLVIEPGMAFGTGQHATTRLCLEQLETRLAGSEFRGNVQRLLDVGTGTGILAIAARKMGVRDVLGTDIDHDAVSAALRNAKENGVEIRAERTSVPPLKGGEPAFDIVIANILTVVLETIMDDLSRVGRPGGYVILSGILEEEANAMATLARGFGLSQTARRQRDGWCCLELKKAGA